MSGKVANKPPAHKRPMHFSKRPERQYQKPPAHKRVPHVWKAPELTKEEREDIYDPDASATFTKMSFMESLIRAGLIGPGPAHADVV